VFSVSDTNAPRLSRTDYKWTLKALTEMSLALTIGTLFRFIELRIDGFPTWPYVLFAGGLYWLLASRKIRTLLNTYDKLLLSVSYGLCGLLIGTIPNLNLILILGLYYASVLPFLVPIYHKVNTMFFSRGYSPSP
jgi:hypothetical protein